MSESQSLLITSAAHFWMAPCGHHGAIVFRNGMRGEIVYSKDDALAQMADLHIRGFVLEYELPELERQIGASPLPHEVVEEPRLHRTVVLIARRPGESMMTAARELVRQYF